MRKIALIMVMAITIMMGSASVRAEGSKTVSLQIVKDLEESVGDSLALDYAESNQRLFLSEDGLKTLFKALDTKDVTFRMFTEKEGAEDQELSIYKLLPEGRYKGIGFCMDGVSLDGSRKYDFLSSFNGRAWYNEGKYYYPLRAICEYMGYSVTWVEKENRITIK